MPTSMTIAPGLTNLLSIAFGFTDRNDKNIRLLSDLFHIRCAGMTDRNGCILAKQQHRYRLADNVASADDDGMLAGNVNAASLDQLNHACRRTWQQAVVADNQIAYAFRVEAVYVFIDANGINNCFLVNMLRQRQLNKNTVNCMLDCSSGQ